MELTGIDYLIGVAAANNSPQAVQAVFQDVALGGHDALGYSTPLLDINRSIEEELSDHELTAARIFQAAIMLVTESGDEQSLRDILAVACQLAANWGNYRRIVDH